MPESTDDRPRGESIAATDLGIAYDVARAKRLAAAREAFPVEQVARFERGMFETDQTADRVVEAFASMAPGQGWRLLDQALAAGTPMLMGAPEALGELLATLMDPPAWLDLERVDAGAAVWWRFFPANVIGLGGALLVGYRHGDLVKPQAFNGRSEKMAARRYEETARWVFAATEPGGLHRQQSGFNETITIRLVHAVVRRRLRLDPVLRPITSQLVWGGTNAILEDYLDGTSRSNRKASTYAVALLRAAVALRERLRRRGRLGSDLTIAARQRAGFGLAMSALKFAERPLQPHEASAS